MDSSDFALINWCERFKQLYSNYSELSKIIERESPSLAKGVRLRLLSLRGSWVQIPSPALFFDEKKTSQYLHHYRKRISIQSWIKSVVAASCSPMGWHLLSQSSSCFKWLQEYQSVDMCLLQLSQVTVVQMLFCMFCCAKQHLHCVLISCVHWKTVGLQTYSSSWSLRTIHRKAVSTNEWIATIIDLKKVFYFYKIAFRGGIHLQE